MDTSRKVIEALCDHKESYLDPSKIVTRGGVKSRRELCTNCGKEIGHEALSVKWVGFLVEPTEDKIMESALQMKGGHAYLYRCNILGNLQLRCEPPKRLDKETFIRKVL